MQNEHAQNVNFLRGILSRCEEVALKTQRNGVDGEHLRTEADTSNARKRRDWFAAKPSEHLDAQTLRPEAKLRAGDLAKPARRWLRELKRANVE